MLFCTNAADPYPKCCRFSGEMLRRGISKKTCVSGCIKCPTNRHTELPRFTSSTLWKYCFLQTFASMILLNIYKLVSPVGWKWSLVVAFISIRELEPLLSGLAGKEVLLSSIWAVPEVPGWPDGFVPPLPERKGQEQVTDPRPSLPAWSICSQLAPNPSRCPHENTGSGKSKGACKDPSSSHLCSYFLVTRCPSLIRGSPKYRKEEVIPPAFLLTQCRDNCVFSAAENVLSPL